jgi:hypothetical protein
LTKKEEEMATNVSISLDNLTVLLRIAVFNHTLYVRTMQILNDELRNMVYNYDRCSDDNDFVDEKVEKSKKRFMVAAFDLGIDTDSKEFQDDALRWFDQSVPIIISNTSCKCM